MVVSNRINAGKAIFIFDSKSKDVNIILNKKLILEVWFSKINIILKIYPNKIVIVIVLYHQYGKSCNVDSKNKTVIINARLVFLTILWIIKEKIVKNINVDK